LPIRISEGWSQIIHENWRELQQTQTGTPFRPQARRGGPWTIFHDASVEFDHQCVRANEAQFIWGLQPASWNKRHLHRWRHKYRGSEKNNAFIDVIRLAIPVIRKDASEQLNKMDCAKMDFYKEFGKIWQR